MQRRAVEIRPVDRQEDEFGIGRLPQQEIRQPLLAGGADDEVGIGNVRGQQRTGEMLDADGVRVELAGRRLRRQSPRRLDDLLPAAIVEGDDERQPAVAARQLLGLVEQRGDVGGEALAAADHPHPHVVGVQFGEIVADEAFQQPHQQRNLLGRTAPVFGRKAVDRQERNADLDGGAHRPPHRLDAAAVAFETRQAARLRPAAVAVHDDGDVPGRLAQGVEIFAVRRHAGSASKRDD